MRLLSCLVTILLVGTITLSDSYVIDRSFAYIEGQYDGKNVTYTGIDKGDIFPEAQTVKIEGRTFWIIGIRIEGIFHIWRPYGWKRVIFE